MQEVCGLSGEHFVTSELATIHNLDWLKRLVAGTLLDALSLLADFEAADNSAEDGVLSVQVRSGSVADKELRSVSVRAGIGHREYTLMSVREPHLLVFELFSVDTDTTSSVSSSSVTTLHHES